MKQPLIKPSDPKLIAKAIAKGKLNLVNFRKIILAVGEDEAAPAPFHYVWSDKLLEGTDNYAVEAFRESGKTQYIIRSFGNYAITFPSTKRDYIVIIKKNATLAKAKLKEIEDECLSNPVVSARIVKIREQSTEVFSIDVRDEKGN